MDRVDMYEDAANEADLDTGAFEQVDDGVEEERQVASQPDHTDWKAQAIEARTRLEMIERMRAESQPAAPQQVDEVSALKQQIEAKRAELPTHEQMNKDSSLFWKRDALMQEIDQLNERLVDTRLRQHERVLAEQHVGTAVQQYKQRFANRATFKSVERQFDQMVGQLEPHLRGNTVMLDMIRSKLELDHMDRTKGQKAPPRAPGSDFQPQTAAQPATGKVKWRNAQDQAVGEYYISRGIISGPEDFYDPKNNERSPSANNNGTAIYDVPTTPRGWRR